MKKRAAATYKQVVDETLAVGQLERILAINEFADSIWKELADIQHWGERSKKMKEIAPERLATILTPAEISLLGPGQTTAPAPTPGN